MNVGKVQVFGASPRDLSLSSWPRPFALYTSSIVEGTRSCNWLQVISNHSPKHFYEPLLSLTDSKFHITSPKVPQPAPGPQYGIPVHAVKLRSEQELTERILRTIRLLVMLELTGELLGGWNGWVSRCLSRRRCCCCPCLANKSPKHRCVDRPVFVLLPGQYTVNTNITVALQLEACPS